MHNGLNLENDNFRWYKDKFRRLYFECRDIVKIDGVTSLVRIWVYIKLLLRKYSSESKVLQHFGTH